MANDQSGEGGVDRQYKIIQVQEIDVGINGEKLLSFVFKWKKINSKPTVVFSWMLISLLILSIYIYDNLIDAERYGSWKVKICMLNIRIMYHKINSVRNNKS